MYAYNNMASQVERANFKQPPYLHPAEKGGAPFRIWCVDTIVNLVPPAPSGATSLIVAIDPFSKWVESGLLPELNSLETANWFHNKVVCRYGLPAIVRTDRGTEYAGQFKWYLKYNGII